jgi:hypothetical protein
VEMHAKPKGDAPRWAVGHRGQGGREIDIGKCLLETAPMVLGVEQILWHVQCSVQRYPTLIDACYRLYKITRMMVYHSLSDTADTPFTH